MPTTNTVTTRKAREKFAKAHGGKNLLPAITQIAFGNGGHDIGGNPILPSDTVVQVPGEFLRKDILGTDVPVDMATTLRISGNLDFDEGNGEMVSAVGLYDSDGDLVAIKTFTPKYKDAATSIEISWDEQF